MSATVGSLSRLPTTRRVALLSAVLALGAAAGCGTEGSIASGEEPPPGQIGFVGGIGPGVGFVGGGRGHHDAGSSPFDAAGVPDARSSADTGTGTSSGGQMQDSGGEDGPAGQGSGEDSGPQDAGSSVGVTINIPSGFFSTLDWTISGPDGTYSGTVDIGAAESIEFVAGGIQAGGGYTVTLSGRDANGDFCSGTSAPFAVLSGGTTAAGVTIECFVGDGGPRMATIMTGNVAVDAGLAEP